MFFIARFRLDFVNGLQCLSRLFPTRRRPDRFRTGDAARAIFSRIAAKANR